jgi:hypothetical protein
MYNCAAGVEKKVRRLLFQCDAHLVLDPDKSCVQNVSAAFSRTWQKMADPLLSKLRVYLNVVSSLDFNVTPAMQQVRDEVL